MCSDFWSPGFIYMFSVVWSWFMKSDLEGIARLHVCSERWRAVGIWPCQVPKGVHATRQDEDTFAHGQILPVLSDFSLAPLGARGPRGRFLARLQAGPALTLTFSCSGRSASQAF